MVKKTERRGNYHQLNSILHGNDVNNSGGSNNYHNLSHIMNNPETMNFNNNNNNNNNTNNTSNNPIVSNPTTLERNNYKDSYQQLGGNRNDLNDMYSQNNNKQQYIQQYPC